MGHGTKRLCFHRFWVASLSLGVSMTANTANASQPASFFSAATRYQSGRKSLPSAESLQKRAFIFRLLLLFSLHPSIFSHINPSLPVEPRTSAAPAGKLGCLGGKDGGTKAQRGTKYPPQFSTSKDSCGWDQSSDVRLRAFIHFRFQRGKLRRASSVRSGG